MTNECTADDTKAAARRRPKCSRKTKNRPVLQASHHSSRSGTTCDWLMQSRDSHVTAVPALEIPCLGYRLPARETGNITDISEYSDGTGNLVIITIIILF